MPSSYKTPEKKPADCKHSDVHHLRIPEGLSFCKSCGFGFYKVRIKSHEPCLKPQLEYRYHQAESPRLFFHQGNSFGHWRPPSNFECTYWWVANHRKRGFFSKNQTPLTQTKVRGKMIKELWTRACDMEINDESRYLAVYIQDYFGLMTSEKAGPSSFINNCDLYSAGA